MADAQVVIGICVLSTVVILALIGAYLRYRQFQGQKKFRLRRERFTEQQEAQLQAIQDLERFEDIQQIRDPEQGDTYRVQDTNASIQEKPSAPTDVQSENKQTTVENVKVHIEMDD